ncbi:MAG: biopolymer transporter ExbD, partial [Planctomycetota bacterium]
MNPNRDENDEEVLDHPPLSLRVGGAGEEDDLDMTPMVDVTFLLLIFFMITAAFALQKAIAVPPTSDEESTTAQTLDDLEENAVVVRLDADNVYWVVC